MAFTPAPLQPPALTNLDHLLICESEIRQWELVGQLMRSEATRQRERIEYFHFQAEIRDPLPYASMCEAHRAAEVAFLQHVEEARTEVANLKVVATQLRKKVAADKAKEKAAAADDAIEGLKAMRDVLGGS